MHLQRIRNGTAVASEWVDPDDADPNRRTARRISGHRASDSLSNLFNIGTISRSQQAAGARYRRAWELGEMGPGGSAISRLGTTSGGSSDAGPSEIRLAHLERYQSAKKAAGRLSDILHEVVCNGASLRAYATRWQMHQSAAMGRLIAALDVLRDHWDTVDAPRKREVSSG